MQCPVKEYRGSGASTLLRNTWLLKLLMDLDDNVDIEIQQYSCYCDSCSLEERVGGEHLYLKMSILLFTQEYE